MFLEKCPTSKVVDEPRVESHGLSPDSNYSVVISGATAP